MWESPERFKQLAERMDLRETLDFRSRGQVIRNLVFAFLIVIAFLGLTFWPAW